MQKRCSKAWSTRGIRLRVLACRRLQSCELRLGARLSSDAMETAMRLRTRDLRRIAVMVAIALAFATLPAGAGVVIVSSPTPAFTLDICHPLPGMDRTPDTLSLARPAPAADGFILAEIGRSTVVVLARSDAFDPAPDPPPPKPRA
jgi:hypothetical protein